MVPFEYMSDWKEYWSDTQYWYDPNKNYRSEASQCRYESDRKDCESEAQYGYKSDMKVCESEGQCDDRKDY